MTFGDYYDKINTVDFIEFPWVITGGETHLSDIVDFDEADHELKLYLAEVVICRCFSATGGISFPQDSRWFIVNFLRLFKNDVPKPWSTSAVKAAIEMILSDDVFSKVVIATTFMFGVVELYLKHFLGFDPFQFDFFDEDNHSKFRNMYIGDAVNKLKKTNTAIARSLNRIDKHNKIRLKDFGIVEKRWVRASISDRLSLARNTMSHGENYSFYHMGEYLCLLYILMYLHSTGAVLKNDS